MAIDMFLKLDGINGESLDRNHKQWVDVLAWSWGMSNSGSTHVGGGAGAGKANFQDLSYTSYLDASSTPLMKALATGDHLGSALLNVRGAAGSAEFLKITMSEVLVTSLSTGGSGGEDRLTQNVSLNFAKVKVEYQQTSSASGKPIGTPLVFEFDIAENTIP